MIRQLQQRVIPEQLRLWNCPSAVALQSGTNFNGNLFSVGVPTPWGQWLTHRTWTHGRGLCFDISQVPIFSPHSKALVKPGFPSGLQGRSHPFIPVLSGSTYVGANTPATSLFLDLTPDPQATGARLSALLHFLALDSSLSASEKEELYWCSMNVYSCF